VFSLFVLLDIFCCCSKWKVESVTYINNPRIPRSFPIIYLQHGLLQIKNLLDIIHKLDEILLAPAFLFALAIILNKLPTGLILPKRLALMVQRKSSIAHIGRQIFLVEGVSLQRGVEHHHGCTGIVENGGDEGF